MGPGITKTTVLVVEPDAFMRLALAARLEEHPYVQVIATANGVRTALSKIAGLQPDWVVVDLCRDTEEGLSMLEAMHEAKAGSRVAAIATAGLDPQSPTIRRAKAAGASAIVRSGSKPGAPYVADDVGRELLATILRAAGWRAALDRHREPGEDVLATSPSSKARAPAPVSRALTSTSPKPPVRQGSPLAAAGRTAQPAPSGTRPAAKHAPATATPTQHAPSRSAAVAKADPTKAVPTKSARGKPAAGTATPASGAGWRSKSPPAARSAVAVARYEDSVGMPPGACRVIGIGVSTGGPLTLHKLLPLIPADLGIPIVIVQHMPAAFTKSLADSLNKACQLPVTEAKDGDVVTGGRILIAPGGRHMRVDRSMPSPIIRITDDPPECSCRPSVDYLFRSLAATFGRATLGVVLTGMGEDGWLGSREMHSAGGKLLAQDEASCAVFGMPRGPIKAGIARAVSLDGMVEAILAVARSARCG